MKKSCFIIAEAGVNHNGSLANALKLVEVAAQSGADAVKFQTFKAEKLVAVGAAKAEYQKQQLGEDGDQFSMLKALELSDDDHEKIAAHCQRCGIQFMSTPFDIEAADFLLKLGMKTLKIPSGELTNYPFIAELAQRNVPMILSTGMGALAEIEEAVTVIRQSRAQAGLGELPPNYLTILHCTSNYPAKAEDVNLLAMQTIADRVQLPIGYSDHTLGITIAIAAVAMGAMVIEKHFTLDKAQLGPDHAASLQPQELKAMIDAIRQVEAAQGDGVKAPRPSELPVRSLVRRSLTLVKAVKAGDCVSSEDVQLLRPGTGIEPKFLASVIGQKTYAHDLPQHTTLQWSDLL